MAQARFTPSLLDEDTLEALFVHRRPLLDDAVARAERAATTSERAHRLLVGPRGAGKTHLISLVYYRVRELQQSGRRLGVSWLPEDPWSIDSYEDLLFCILEHLEAPPALDGSATVLDRRQPANALELAMTAKTAEIGPIVVLVENLDQVLDNLGESGQRRLRAFLENERPVLLIATATRLTDYLLNQADTFYGFFDTTTLAPFDAPQAAEMLQAIARVQGDKALERRLSEPSSHARLAAVEHLAGGQPRVWALLASGLRLSDLDELINTLIERFDDLTPFYQEQLARLSPRERLVVRTLADADRAMNVNELADTTRTDNRSLAKTISDLRQRGWVRPRSGRLVEMADRRLTFYELAEPLARLAIQLKASRGKPVKLVLDFLVTWFEQEEFSAATPASPLASNYLAQAQLVASGPAESLTRALAQPTRATFFDPTVALFAARSQNHQPVALGDLEALDDACAALGAGDPRPLLEQPSSISHLIEHRLGAGTVTAVRFDIAMMAAAVDPTAWTARAEALLAAAPETERASVLLLALLTQNFKEPSAASDLMMAATQAAIAVDNNPQLPERGLHIAFELLRWQAPAVAGSVLEGIGDKVPPELLIHFAVASTAVAMRTGRAAAAPDIWERTVTRLIEALGADHPNTLTARGNLASSYRSAGRTNDAITLEEAVLADSERILGADHPNTLITRSNLASSYWSAGRTNDALTLFEAVLADSERILGTDHPDTVTTRELLAEMRKPPPAGMSSR